NSTDQPAATALSAACGRVGTRTRRRHCVRLKHVVISLRLRPCLRDGQNRGSDWCLNRSSAQAVEENTDVGLAGRLCLLLYVGYSAEQARALRHDGLAILFEVRDSLQDHAVPRLRAS